MSVVPIDARQNMNRCIRANSMVNIFQNPPRHSKISLSAILNRGSSLEIHLIPESIESTILKSFPIPLRCAHTDTP